MAMENENLPEVTPELEPLDEWETDPQTITEIQQHVASELPVIPLEEAPVEATARFMAPEILVTPTEGETIRIPIVDAAPEPPVGTGVPDGPFGVPDGPAPEPQQTQCFTPVEAADKPPVPQPAPEPVSPISPVTAPPQTQYFTPVGIGVPDGPVTQTPDPVPPEQPTKTRPGAKKGYGLLGIPHVVSTVIWLALIVVIGVSLGRMLWVCCADLMAFGKPDREIPVTITAQDVRILPDGSKEVDIDAIAQKLGDAGLIQYPALFKLFAQVTGKDQSIVPGDYTLNSYFDYNAMINGMCAYEKPRSIVTVLIPEGYNCAQLFALLEENGVCTVQELEECAANGDQELGQYWFLTDEIPWGEKYCLEGYLFPDTYDFYTNEDPAHVLNKMLQNFDNRFTDKMKTDLAVIEARYGLTLHEVLTIASMVEEEAVGATKTTGEFEGYNIASVYYNRLANWAVPILGCDATVYYAMGDYFGQAGDLTAAHLATDSPYNTRKYAGLPPGPITNPGSYSMYAALAPADTEYYYYVYDPEQKRHILSKTEEEHNKLVAELGY